MAEFKQYVNLDPTKPNQLAATGHGAAKVEPERAGREVLIKVKINKKKKGVPIIFELKMDPKNVVNKFDLSEYKPRQRVALIKGLPGAGSRQTLKRRVRTDKKGEASTKLIVSNFGGDKYTVEAYMKKKPDKKLVSDTYVTWRRIYYQVSRFKSGPRGAGRTGGALPAITNFDWTGVIDEYKARQHNIELADDTTTDLVARRFNVLGFKRNQQQQAVPINTTDFLKSASVGYDPKREPVSMRVVLVHQIAVATFPKIRLTSMSEGDVVTKTIPKKLWKDESKALGYDALTRVRWRRKGSKVWNNMPRKYVEVIYPNKVKVDFSKLKIKKKHFFDFFRKVEVELRVMAMSGGFNGLSLANTIWIAKSSMYGGDRAEAGKIGTTIHETGHFIDLVPAAQTTTHYTGRGHQGGHCSQGLSAADKALPSYSGKSGTCVMFGESASSRINKFCGDCDPSVRKSPVIVGKMPANWK